jgi:hypothetical protein
MTICDFVKKIISIFVLNKWNVMIYSFIIKTTNKNFIREYHIPSESSLYDFKRFIADDLDFDESQQSVFFLLDENGKKLESYSLFDMGYGAMDSVTLEDLNSKGMTNLLYTFDFFNDRSLYIEFLGETEIQLRTYYPLVVMSKGDAPGQFFEKLDDNIDDRMLNDDDDDEEDEKKDDEDDDDDDEGDDELSQYGLYDDISIIEPE